VALRQVLGTYRVAVETAAIVAALVAIRAVIWHLGVTGMSTTPLASSIIGGGVFVMGLVVAGTLSDYRDAERAPTDIAASLYALLREAEAMHSVWGKPDREALRSRLIAVVTSLRSDINAGDTRDCQAAVEEISESLRELEDSDVPANYIVRLRSEQAALRKATLRMYHIQREAFLPSAKAMIMSLVAIIMVMLLFTDMGGYVESLVTLGFLSFFFVYLLRIINVIDKPFKVGRERTDDDVSLFLLTEFVVHAHVAGTGEVAPEDVAAHAEVLEQRLLEVEEAQAEEREAAEQEEEETLAAAEKAAEQMVEDHIVTDEESAREKA
jgi:ABC-type multidrug transport system fused ATPase/permease subunit